MVDSFYKSAQLERAFHLAVGRKNLITFFIATDSLLVSLWANCRLIKSSSIWTVDISVRGKKVPKVECFFFVFLQIESSFAL